MTDRVEPIHRPIRPQPLGRFVCDRVVSETVVYRSNFNSEVEMQNWAEKQVQDYYALLVNGNVIQNLGDLPLARLEKLQSSLNASIQSHTQRVVREELQAA